MSKDTAELIERLRAIFRCIDDPADRGDCNLKYCNCNTMDEAAALLSALQEQNERYRQALEPFAAYSKSSDESWPTWHEDHHTLVVTHDAEITFGDLRRARSALSENEG